MQNFTGTGFTNEEIKKEDIVKQIKNKTDAIDNMHRLTSLATGYGSKRFEEGIYGGVNSSSKAQKVKAAADAEFDKFKKLNLEIIKYLREMPHD
tara:strand:+ start:116 stop:397 length:282 start_codon:yes stop_codon:yes gene_type:complete